MYARGVHGLDCELSVSPTMSDDAEVCEVPSVATPSCSKERHLQAVIGGLELAQSSIADAIKIIQEQRGNHDGALSESQGSEVRGRVSQQNTERSRPSLCNVGHKGSRATIRHFGKNVDFESSIASANMREGIAARLPANWPSGLGVRQIAGGSHSSLVGPSFTVSKTFMNEGAEDDPFAGSMAVKTEAEKKTSAQCIREPDSAVDQVCNVCGFVMLLYDLVVMPVVLAWDLPFEGSLIVLAWLSLAFWVCDLLLSFFTGFFQEGELNMDVQAAAWHYFRTWFLPDVLVVLCDLLSLVFLMSIDSENSSGVSLRIARFAKLGRILRITSLLRAFRTVRKLEAMMVRSLSEMQRTCLQLMVIAVCWLWMNHILACVWFAIGSYAPSDTGARWLERLVLPEAEDFHYKQAGHMFQYATALHWAIAQTTMGAMEVVCVNSAERICNVTCLLIGLFFGSSLISSLSAGMIEFRMSMQIRSHTMSTLRRYLLENNVNKKVAILAQRQAAARLSDTAMLTAKDVPALATLATGIQHKLHLEICQPHLQRHQLFQLWLHMDSHWFEQFCSKAVNMQFLRPEDDLFQSGSESAAAYFIISGLMEYTQIPESSPVLQTTRSSVEHSEWLCESTLWVHWIHVGKMEATTRCQVLAIQVEGFASAMREHFTIGAVAADYGRIFAERVVSAKPPDLPWPDDRSVPFAEFCDVVVALPAEMHVLIGSVALDNCKSGFMGLWKNTQAQSDLRQEVEDGRSIVIQSLSGELERVVSLAVMHIARGDGRVLVQLAKWNDSQAVPDIQLPGVKCRRNESSDEAVQRLLSTKLAPLADGVEVLAVERGSEEQTSFQFGMRTLYMRKLFYAIFRGHFSAPLCPDEGMMIADRASDRWTSGQTMDRWASGIPVMDVFENVPVHYIRREVCGARHFGAFYAWLREIDIQMLKALNNSTVVRRRLSNLRPPDVPVSGTPSGNSDSDARFCTTTV